MLDRNSLDALTAKVAGDVISPDSPGYETARKVFNGMIDRHPAAIVRCIHSADVAAAIQFGVSRDLRIAIRGGGHNAGGLSVCDDGLVIDLSWMREVRVDGEARTVKVQGGATWHDVDLATHPFGMAVPSGIISTTGVGGLTLGGGTSYLTRRFGLTIDNLLGADVRLADGREVHCSEEDQPDLFWALRGGGGNFGVVTSFEFRLQPVDTVLAGPTLWPLERAREVIQWYREFILDAPEDLNGFLAFMTVPPVAPFPPELHNQKVCAIVWCWSGPLTRGDEVFAPVKALQPVLFGVGPAPWPAVQSMFDPLLPPGLQWYWRADFVDTVPDAAIDRHLDFAARLPTPLSLMHLYPTDGAAQQVGRSDTAFSYREANFSMVICGVDPDPAQREAITSWTRSYWDAVHPYSLGGAYVNFLMGDEGPSRIQTTYRDNLPRLLEVKRRYDPENRFNVNQNIDPKLTAATQASPRP
jgi:FAD/FMN-containing dehydrogenase